MPRNIVVLDSGSLDSLAARVVLERAAASAGVAVIHVQTGFVRADRAAEVARREVAVLDVAPVFASDVALAQARAREAPECTACRAFLLKRVEAATGCWLATGEVLGQHPVNQSRAALARVDREAGMEGRVLRPLSALLLPASDAESRGAVRRAALGTLHGRGRAAQRALVGEAASHLGPQPGGKCCELRDPTVFRRLRDLAAHGDPIEDVALVRIGRHFRVTHETRVIVARSESEELDLERRADPRYYRLRVAQGPGALCVLATRCADEDVLLRAAALAVRYAGGTGPRAVGVWREGERRVVQTGPPDPERLAVWRL